MTLLERERSLQDLTQWLDTAVHQGGLVVLVEGEAGIGKTSLLQAFAAAQRLAPRVLWGGCDALLTPRPLAPLHDIARQTQQALLAAMHAGSRDGIFTATLDEFERQPPALMVLEDLHWADDATLDLLKFLRRRIARTRALLVVTYRDDDLGPRHPLRSVIGDLPRASLRRLHLTPLSEGAVLTLAEEAGRSAPELHAATGGNPVLRDRGTRVRQRRRARVGERCRAGARHASATGRARDRRTCLHRARPVRVLAAAGVHARPGCHRGVSRHRHGARRGRFAGIPTRARATCARGLAAADAPPGAACPGT